MGNSMSPDDSSATRILVGLIRLLVAAGMPAAGWIFAQSITKNPWQQVSIALLGLVLGLFINLFSKVWERLGDWLADHTANWIKSSLRKIFIRYRRYYCQHLVYDLQVSDVKGLTTRAEHSLELEQVFVQLDIHTIPDQQASTNLLKLSAQPGQQAHDIWYYLTQPVLAGQHFVVIGPPGSGKTTLLKHIALGLAQFRRPRHARMARKLPIFLYLRDHAETIQKTPDCTLVDLVEQHLQSKWNQEVPARWFAGYLQRGKCLVLLDGLDEVADASTRKLVADWAQRQMRAYFHNRFILTSRPYGYRDNPLEGVSTLEVRPFTLAQVKKFIYQWYRANQLKSWGKDDPGMRRRAREGAEDLLSRLYQKPELLELAVNPLLLTMIVTVHHVRHALPGKRVELYEEMCNVLSGKRREDTGIPSELSAAQMQLVLKPLAYHLMQQKTLEIKTRDACRFIKPYLSRVSTTMQPETFLRMVENASGLFLEQNPGIYSFVHPTFQEYLAATYIANKGLESELIKHIGDDWWHETIRLYCAQADATNIIEACLSQASTSAKVLTLALECNDEKREAQPFVEQHVNELIERGVDDPDPAKRLVVAEALLNRRLQSMEHLYNEVYVDTSFITFAEYQVFLYLEEMIPSIELFDRPEQAKEKPDCRHIPLHWLDTFPSRREPILGLQLRDALAFCDWLNSRNKGVWYYHLPYESEIERIEVKLAEKGQVKSGLGYWINAVKSFAWIGGRAPEYENLPDLLQSVLDDDLRQADAFDRIRSSVHDQMIDRALELGRELDPRHVPYISFGHEDSYARALNLHQVLAKANEVARLYSDPLTDALIFTIQKIQDTIPPFDENDHTMLWYIRYLSQLLYYSLDPSAGPPPRRTWLQKWFRRRRRSFAEEVSTAYWQASRDCLDIYLAFAILELRMQGKLPPWEGILLVKERVQL